MDELHIFATRMTPGLYFSPEKGILKIAGVSLADNNFQFYHKLIERMREYAKSPAQETRVSFAFSHINSGGIGILRMILTLLEKAHDKGLTSLKVDWTCEKEDQDQQDLSKELLRLYPDLDVSFNLVDELEQMPKMSA